MQQSPDIATLLERFDEPLRGEGNAPAPAASAQVVPDQVVPVPGHRFARPPHQAPVAIEPPAAEKKSGATIASVIWALAGIIVAPAALLLALWWQGILPGDDEAAPAEEATVVVAPAADEEAQPKQSANAVEFALSSPDRIEAEAGDFVAFPITIDATGALPARSIVAITALPEGAAFSEGRPFGATGWSLRPDEIGGLRLRLPAKGDTADLRLEFLSGDGTVLSQSETQLSIAPLPANDQLVASAESPPSEPSASQEQTGTVAALPPAPEQKPDVKVNTVKTVAIAPPSDKEPYDGGYGLGQAADGPAEWMVTKTAVDMHAKAEQKSETVKVAQGGIKVQVKARDKNWIQVHDPESATTGWIYNRFLKPADPQ